MDGQEREDPGGVRLSGRPCPLIYHLSSPSPPALSSSWRIFIYPIHIHDSHDPRKFLAITRGLPVYRIKQYHDPVCASLLVCLVLILPQPESESESVPLLPSSCMDITFYLRHFSPVLRDLQSQARHHIAPAAQVRVVASASGATHGSRSIVWRQALARHWQPRPCLLACCQHHDTVPRRARSRDRTTTHTPGDPGRARSAWRRVRGTDTPMQAWPGRHERGPRPERLARNVPSATSPEKPCIPPRTAPTPSSAERANPGDASALCLSPSCACVLEICAFLPVGSDMCVWKCRPCISASRARRGLRAHSRTP